jgi:hypothetical protein
VPASLRACVFSCKRDCVLACFRAGVLAWRLSCVHSFFRTRVLE